MPWKCHVDNYTNIRYDMILGRYLLTALGLDIKFSKNIIICGDGPFKECPAPMLDVSTYVSWFSIESKLLQPEYYLPPHKELNSK